MSRSRILTLLSLILCSVTAIGCGHQSNNPSDREAEFNGPSIIPQEILSDIDSIEGFLLPLANTSLSKQTFANQHTWYTHGALLVKEHLTVEATADIQDCRIDGVERLNSTSYQIAFTSNALVHLKDLKYHARDVIKATVSNAKIPLLIRVNLSVRTIEKDDSITFEPGTGGKFIKELVINIEDFKYESTFLENLPKEDRHSIRNKARDLLQNLISHQDGSVAAKLDVDLNKASTSDKIDLGKILAKIKETK